MQNLKTEAEEFFPQAKGRFYGRLFVGNLLKRANIGRFRRHLSRRVACEMAFQEEFGRHYSDEKEPRGEARSTLSDFSFLSLV